MGATFKLREFDVDRPSHTEELSNWILRVRSKKVICRRSRKRNLRMEAVLTYALTTAERELRSKQILRFNRWQQVKDKLTVDHKDCTNGEDFSSIGYERLEGNVWKTPLCSELSSLDSFMSMLKEIKVPLQR
ncbi:uncharacterized protein LOC105691881 [Athalia rosae]|uniref:uncharacterized protein LOC105691881 n=1 Tax=Athalia rosae TaxID=37344 RepID=UPI002033B765|nr:uncharacterized protein LOC105691881 [Athalia rosae]